MNQLIKEKLPDLRKLCQTYDVKSMYVFGSANNGQFKSTSDVDFLVSFKKEISIEKYTDNYFNLHYKLEELLNRKIDLLTENSLSNPYFIEGVEASKELLYAA